MKHSPDFVKLMLFSDEEIFHLKWSVNRKNSSHRAKENPNWIPLTVPCDGVSSSRLLEGNRSHLHRWERQCCDLPSNDRKWVYPQFMDLKKSSQILFQQCGVPPHWARSVQDWLNDNLLNRWIGGGNPDDQHISWPRSRPIGLFHLGDHQV